MKKMIIILFLVTQLSAVEINIDASAGRKPISPFIFGRNNSLSDNPAGPVTQENWELYIDAGVRFFRENGGNNCTKYNFRKKLGSHPDWYNNVYYHNWDFAAMSLDEYMPWAKGMWGFQLLGWVADDNSHNFNDWGYNQSQWWEGVSNNWAGDGGPEQGDGDISLYLTEWPADSTTAILDWWFDGLGLNPEMFQYWNMDNEPEIWNGTHDDIVTEPMQVEEFMQLYFQVAKKAREKYPEIKLVGPVTANEWQWYNWNNDKISYGGKSYTWLEYFIKRIAEEQIASGIRLLDVLDLHFYPGESNASDIVQLHRVWFDKTFNYPGANGVKRAGTSGWDNNIKSEYIFQRCRDWLEKHIGPDHGVTFSLTEIGIGGGDPNVTASWYASTLGVFADEGVEILTPWYWKIGMWEVMHLFSKNSKSIRTLSTSDNEEFVSAYSSISTDLDSMTVFLVNRSLGESQTVNVHFNNFNVTNGNHTLLQLNSLPDEETFFGENDNALISHVIAVQNNAVSIVLPALSETALLLSGQGFPTSVEKTPESMKLALDVYPNPFNPVTNITFTAFDNNQKTIKIYDVNGRLVTTLLSRHTGAGTFSVQFDASGYSSGVYFVRLSGGHSVLTRKILLVK